LDGLRSISETVQGLLLPSPVVGDIYSWWFNGQKEKGQSWKGEKGSEAFQKNEKTASQAERQGQSLESVEAEAARKKEVT
jgi:hypothetical protein